MKNSDETYRIDVSPPPAPYRWMILKGPMIIKKSSKEFATHGDAQRDGIAEEYMLMHKGNATD